MDESGRTDLGELRDLVALGSRILSAEGHDDFVWGHLAARDPDGRGAWLKQSGWGFGEIDRARVHLVDREGRVVEGTGRRHLEYPIHLEILAARPDVRAVVHSHPRHAIAFAALDVPFRPISHEATVFVPPDIPRFRDTSDLIVSPELGAAVAQTLGPGPALLLVHHGIVAVGPDVPTAVVTAILLERACRTQLLALSAGGPALWSSDDDALAMREHGYPPRLMQQAWDYLVRQVTNPGRAPAPS
jgi:L-fuculose-phosphate aldolase